MKKDKFQILQQELEDAYSLGLELGVRPGESLGEYYDRLLSATEAARDQAYKNFQCS